MWREVGDKTALEELCMRIARIVVVGVAVVLGGTVAVASARPTPQQICAAAKAKCITKKTHALFTCHAKAENSGAPLNDGCMQRGKDKFLGCMEKADAPGSCLDPGDGPHLGDDVDAFVADVVGDVNPGVPAPVKNKCSAAKEMCMDKMVAALFLCHGRAFLAGTEVNQACEQAASGKFTDSASGRGCMDKAEKKGPCLAPNGDGPHLEEDVVAFVDDLVGDLSGLAPAP